MFLRNCLYLEVAVALRNISDLNHRIEAEGPRHMPLSRKEIMYKKSAMPKQSLNQGER